MHLPPLSTLHSIKSTHGQGCIPQTSLLIAHLIDVQLSHKENTCHMNRVLNKKNKSTASWHELHNIQTSLLVAHLIGVVKATQCELFQVWASFKRQILRIRITNANSHSVSCLFSGHAGETEMKRGQKMNPAFTCIENISWNLASNYMVSESEKFNCHVMEDARVAAVEKLEQWLTVTWWFLLQLTWLTSSYHVCSCDVCS